MCSLCVMDTSDDKIEFDQTGVCEYCNNFRHNILPEWEKNCESDARLQEIADTIKRDGSGKDFDCIIGLSGGLDSSYAAHVAVKKMGLKPLLFHVDAGWNTDQAVANIECLVDGLGIDLYTDVINWNDIRELQLAFLKSGIPDQDLVQDAAFFSGLYRYAREFGIKHIITGSNYSTECCREPESWGGFLGIDKMLFADIWAKHGREGYRVKMTITDILYYKIWLQKIRRTSVHHVLNYTHFSKKDAEKTLEDTYGWRRFKHKHHESRFTRFFEDYWLTERFGFDKRKAHFSSLIMTGQMTRDEAMKRLERPEMSEMERRNEFRFVASKLELSEEQLTNLLYSPKRTFRDYRSKRELIVKGAKILRYLGLERRYFR